LASTQNATAITLASNASTEANDTKYNNTLIAVAP
jgi:hypothetical protein